MHVSRFPVMIEPARKSVDEAVAVPSNAADSSQAQAVTIVGVLQDGDYDRYAVSLKKGQRLTPKSKQYARRRFAGYCVDGDRSKWPSRCDQ